MDAAAWQAVEVVWRTERGTARAIVADVLVIDMSDLRQPLLDEDELNADGQEHYDEPIRGECRA
jgi:hypothetical protein